MTEKKAIGIFSNSLHVPYHKAIIESIFQEAEKNSYPLICMCTDSISFDNLKAKNKLYQLASDSLLGGLLVLPGVLKKHSYEEKIKLSLIVQNIPTVYIGIDVPDKNRVILDNKTAFKEVIHHLIVDHNRKKIAFIKGLDDNYDSDTRFHAYLEVMSENHCKINKNLIIENGSFILESGKKAISVLLDERHLKVGNDFDAIAAANDAMAIGAMEALQQRQIKIPEDVAVIGFDNYILGRFMEIPLTTVDQNLRNIGKKAFQQLLNTDPNPKKILLSTQAVYRNSCGSKTNFKQENPKLGHDINRANIGLHLKKDLSKLTHLILMKFNLYGDEQNIKKQINQLLEDFMELLKDPKSTSFMDHTSEYINYWILEKEDILQWHIIIEILNQWLLNHTQDTDLLKQIHESFSYCHEIITRKISKNEAEKQELSANYHVDLGRIEAKIKSTFNISELLNIIAENISSLSIESYHILFLLDTNKINQDLILVLSVENHKIIHTLKDKKQYADFNGFYSSLKPIDKKTQHLLLPITYSDTIYGYILFYYQGNPLCFEAYESLTDHIGIALMSCRLLDHTKQVNKKLEQTQKELEREIRVAKNIQNAMKPNKLKNTHFDISAQMKTAVSVGGDYYDYVSTPDRDWFVIGDASGHGVHAGLIMMMVRTLTQHCIRQNHITRPKDIINHINPVITDNIKRLGESKYMTLLVLAHKGQGKFAAAGMHLPLLIYRNHTRTIDVLDTKGMWIGVLEDISHLTKEIEFTLEIGDSILLYTDGITETIYQRSPRVMFGDANLKEIFRITGHLKSEEIIKQLFTAVDNLIIEDDITLFAIKRIK